MTLSPPKLANADNPRASKTRNWLAWAGRIRIRLLVVNSILVVVPVAGLEFARLYERQLLESLERDMRNQAVLLGQMMMADLDRSVELGDAGHERAVTRAARSTRTRIRIVDNKLSVLVDSHRNGPPEGREPSAPSLTRTADVSHAWFGVPLSEGPDVPLSERQELRRALQGQRATATRLRAEPPAVLLFLAEPLRREKAVVGAVYVTRSTQPVLVELHRIRSGLLVVLALSVLSTALVTLLLAWTLTRPIERLARVARQISAGNRDVEVPVGGGGELTELSAALSEMTSQLHARHRYISEFAADVAHEFKSPLTSIRGAAELLAEGAADDPATRARFLRNILLDSERLDRLVSRLLELSRIESSEEPLTRTHLDELVRRAIERCESPDQPIDYGAPIEPLWLKARPRDLETALLNLLDNALRHSPPCAQVEVSVSRSNDGKSLAISVKDHGPGVQDHLKTRVFERFFTTSPDSGGTGLGLSIVSSVARAHGGRVELESAPGQGARFTLWLPAGE